MPYTGYDFSPTSSNDSQIYGFDFSVALASGDGINSATFSLLPVVGTDPNPEGHLVGSPHINGLVVSQTIANLLSGVSYCVVCTITTLSGQTISVSAGLSCVNDCVGHLS